jgi:hypothetical protein
LTLDDAGILAILAVVTGEALAAGSAVVELVGHISPSTWARSGRRTGLTFDLNHG